MIEDDEQKAVAISDTTGRYVGQFKTDAAYRFVPVSDPDNPAYYADTTRYEAVIRITADLARQPRGVAIISHKEVSAGLLSYTESVLNELVRRDKLQRTGIDGLEKIMADLEQEITVPTVKRNAEGDTSSSNTGIAMAAGCDMVITNGARIEELYGIVEGQSIGTRFFAAAGEEELV